MENEKVKEHVKKRYTEIAQKDCSSCSTSCCSASDCGPAPQYIAWKLGYSPNDIESVPEESILGLGCGNPVALASLKEGEFVGMRAIFHREGYLEAVALHVAKRRREKIWISVLPVFLVGFLFIRNFRFNLKSFQIELRKHA